MATSNEKIRGLRAQLPELIAALAGDTGPITFLGIPIPMTDVAGMVAPLIDGEIDKLANMPTDELDEQLERAWQFVYSLRSDLVDA